MPLHGLVRCVECSAEFDPCGAVSSLVCVDCAVLPVCEALGCDDRSLTRHSDGGGRPLWLCERHGDDLAVGFAVKP